MLRSLRIARLLILSVATTLVLLGSYPDASDVRRNPAGCQQISATMIFGGSALAAGLVETITPAIPGNRRAWRVTHYPRDPTATTVNGLDSVAVHVEDTAFAEQQSKAIPSNDCADRIVVGAIRWDAWHGDRSEVGKAVERSLGPAKWHSRLPFFSQILGQDRVRIDGASQAVVDREIKYARMAHLDYWAFLLYDGSNPMSLGLEYYLSSARKRGLRFCVIVQLTQWKSEEMAAKQFQRVAELMRRPEYEKVVGGRPLLYVLDNVPDTQTDSEPAWGFRQPDIALNQLRAAVRVEGNRDPYIVIQDWRPERAGALRLKVNGDAISSYSYQRADTKAPFAHLAEETEQFWEQCRSTGSPVVPIVMTGWDRRPRIDHPVFWEAWQQPNVGIDNYYQPPTSTELSRHLADAVAWIRTHSDAAPAKALLIYAWNENDEGGWLVPTLKGDTWRLQAIRKGLPIKSSISH